MYKKFNDLSFVIGLFFSLVAVILLIHSFTSETATRMTLNTSIVFLVFGLVMMFIKGRKADG